ncbi:DUF1365 family protein [Thalassospira sp.]|uniref:DUF1365 domain-containing protein n=1 Tax=Thalassospira sp. TaxID=1912094 RepID=UPI000C394337|nr:DUF1365 family protein [Thalassospira sp.]MBC05190.1 DUF1365 domain-containing protein [Thalassospira sp.]|tara:strand:+ start:61 stop:894 length:834 start_codon:yes stop_codon:yes gene_type:complete
MTLPVAHKPASALFEGVVTHHRLRPKNHKLRYRVFSFLLDLDEIDGLAAKLKLFSRNRFNLFSFHDRDHADGGKADLRTRLEAILSDHGLADCGHRIRLLCYPRLLGFVFNPLSVYFCHRADGSVGAVLYEVSNTFGDRHSYLIPVTDGALDDKNVLRQSCAKGFYVSPFIDMVADYHFRIRIPDENVAVAIRETDAKGAFLNAAFVGDRTELSDRILLGAFIRYPLMTLKVVAGIHWEALHLWRKGMTFHKRPAPPEQAVTYVLETGTAAAQAGKR